MFKSLDTKLVATYALIVAFSLSVAGAATVAVINEMQLRLAERYLLSQAQIFARIIEVTLESGRPLADLRRQLETQATRTQHVFWVAEDGRVLAHVRPPLEPLSLEGQVINGLPNRPALGPAPPGAPKALQALPRVNPSPVGRLDLGPRTLVYAVVPLPRPARPVPPASPAYVGIAQPISEIAAWPLVARPLAVIGLIVFAVTTLLGVWLARSITTPISQMTRASEAMARGDYQQKVQVRGDDEVARLGRAFNTMAKEVDQTHRAQRDFLVNVSHDLKTPLTSIQGFAQAMVDGSLRSVEDYHKAGHIIHTEAERMRRLIGQLLDLARLQSGVAALRREPVDLRGLLAGLASTYAVRASQAGLAFDLHLPDSLPEVMGDTTRLEQVAGNLLDNAFKYTPAGGQVRLSAQAIPGGVTFTVRDTGPGMTREEAQRIFERFYRGDRARVGDGGSGLGLAIVWEIVEAHGGSIEVDSHPGRGTAITVVLPARTATWRGQGAS